MPSETLMSVPCYAEDADPDDLSRPSHLLVVRHPWYGLTLVIDRDSTLNGAEVLVTKRKLQEIIAALVQVTEGLED